MTIVASDAQGRVEPEDFAHEADGFQHAEVHGNADKDAHGDPRGDPRRDADAADAAAARLEVRRRVMLQAAPSDDPWLRDRLAALSLTRLYDPLPARLRVHLDKMQRLLQEGSSLPDNLGYKGRDQ
ncbi:MAG TPA: hypothetical protein VM639_12995 [Dongiaceae bacterium]|nr:hypothetical protein [Dongiaceae bacterium]